MRPMLLALMAAVSLPIALQAQARPMPRRQRIALREAVSSYSHHGEFFLVAANVRPYTVIGADPTRGAADSAAAGAGGGLCTFGPYHGPRAAEPWEAFSI